MRESKARFKIAFCMALLFFMALPLTAQAVNLRYGSWELDGFLRNNTGVWTENWDYADNNDPLATCRNMFRLNLNGDISGNLKLKAEILAVYEPDYPREHGAGDPANYYNYFDFRELRLSWEPFMGQTILIGRQIVNWGESLSARVGDVVNPQDNRFDLGFANLEDTRMPIWMIRGQHNLFSLFSSFEWIFSPYMQPDRYRVNRTESSAGTVNSDGSYTPATRFAAYPETRLYKYFGTNVTALPGVGAFPLPLFGAPFQNIYAGPLTAAQATAAFGPAALGSYPALAAYAVRTANVTTQYPGSSLSDARYGIKTSTAVGGWQTGAYFWHGNEFDPVIKIRGGIPPIGGALDLVVDYVPQNVYGVYGNKLTGIGVFRFDAAYRPGRRYCTLDYAKFPEGITKKDHLIAEVGLDRDVMFRKINPFQPFSFTVEYVGEYILSSNLDDAVVPTYFIPYHKDSHSVFLNASTTYAFGKYTYGLLVLYNARNNGLINPSFTYTPTFMNNKWSFKLAYSNLFGNSDYSYPYGLMREKDFVVLTTQLSF